MTTKTSPRASRRGPAEETTELLGQLNATSEWLGDAKASGVAATDAARAMHRASTPKLTADQRRRVRQLMEDEGETRASAIAWVTEMGDCR